MKKLSLVISLLLIGILPSMAFEIPGLKPKGSVKVGSISSQLLVATISSSEAPAIVAGSGASAGGTAAIIAISFDEDAPLVEGATYDVGLLGPSGRTEPVGITFTATRASNSGRSTTAASGNDTVVTGTVKVSKVSGDSVTLIVKAKATNTVLIKANAEGESTTTTVEKSIPVLIKVKATVQ